MSEPLLPNDACAAHELELCAGCVRDLSLAETDRSAGEKLCVLSEDSDGSEGGGNDGGGDDGEGDSSEGIACSTDSELSVDCVRADGLLPFPPDVDADVCAACAASGSAAYAAVAAGAQAALHAVVFAAGACVARVGRPCFPAHWYAVP